MSAPTPLQHMMKALSDKSKCKTKADAKAKERETEEHIFCQEAEYTTDHWLCFVAGTPLALRTTYEERLALLAKVMKIGKQP